MGVFISPRSFLSAARHSLIPRSKLNCCSQFCGTERLKMKDQRLFKGWFIVLFACLTVSGCYSPPQGKDTAQLFHEADSVNVVLRFYTWNTFYIVQPNFREGGFLRPLKSRDLGGAFSSLKLRRDMAVVLIGTSYRGVNLTRSVDDWKVVLAQHGFRRVVFLRDNDENKLDGLPIIEDWKQPVEQTRQTAQL
jgi:hypothetical protein